MSTNCDIPAGDTEMADCDGENIVTMMDVLKEQQDFEDDANAVLGGSDEKECTYSQGYIKRQAIYSCMTCCPDAKDDPSKRAGFCLACSLSCHENHDLVELYTKRNFRCDCGNPKFKTPCQFTPNKTDLNEENVYNQNFVGLYCICSKPYGDQETSLDDEMIQCIICEDWWHASHLDAVVPAQDQYSEMVCKLCMAKNEFLHDYSNLAVNVENGDVDVIKVNGVDITVNDEKLTNGTMTEEILNGNAVDEKLSNGIEENSTSDDTETITNDATNENMPICDNDTSSTDKDSIESEKLENRSVEKLAETGDENINKPTDAPKETDETDKSTDVIPDISSEDKSEDKISEESEPSAEKTEPTNVSEETRTLSEETSAIFEENSDISEETSKENAKSAGEPEAKLETVENPINTDENDTNSTETSITETDDNNESSDIAVETAIVPNISAEAENPSETIDTSESKATEENATMENASTENDPPSAEDNPPNSEDDPPGGKTNEQSIDDTTDSSKTDETSKDEEMGNVTKQNEEVSNEITSAKENEPIATENCDLNSDSTNKETDENDVIVPVPELASTDNKRKMSTEETENYSPKKPKLDVSKCGRPKDVQKVHKGATFWPATFRQKLCTCNECISMYKDLSVLFLMDPDDTVFAYETLGKERTAGKPNQYEKGMEALCSLGRIQQIDALTEYNKMRDKLLHFLQNFKDRKEIVTEGDIKTFFAGMKPTKRTDGVYFCG